MTELGRHIVTSATGQRGYFTRRQATAGGTTRAMLRSRVQSGDLKRAGARIFSSTLLPPSALGDLTALILDIGEPIFASGPTAAALNGFDGFELAPPFHLTLPRGRNVVRRGHVIHTTNELVLIDRARIANLPTLSATRTIIDLARLVPAAALSRAVDSALRDGLTSETFLHRRIAEVRTPGRHGIPQLLAVLDGAEVASGGHSWLERRFLELVADAALPRPETQVNQSSIGGRKIRVDCWFANANLVVELLGYRWHRSVVEMQRDTERMNRLLLEGRRVLQFTYRDVATTPEATVHTLRDAIAQPQRLLAGLCKQTG